MRIAKLMTKKTKNFILICLLCALLPGIWLISPLNAISEQSGQIDSTDVSEGSGILDGLIFSAMLGPSGKPLDVKDTLVFKNGTFVSEECEKRCNYPAQAYFARRVGEKIEFISETRCLTKDATIVWRGTVYGDRIEGINTWKVNRWYWTVEKDFKFEGSLEEKIESNSAKK